MKILTVVGARPQFIKAAVVSRKLRKHNTEVLVHTGQHYDYDMSGRFFDELCIPKPDFNLGISGGSHAQMTGRMLIAIEQVMLDQKPDCLLVYGDTNSTLAAALAAAKLHIPICHVEAGPRTYCLTNPEEINRICTDHISTLLLACTHFGVEALEKEGIGDRAKFVGDPMFDAFLQYSEMKQLKDVSLISLFDNRKISIPDRFYYLTCHREENTSEVSLGEILKALNSLECSTIFPVHPRNKEKVKQIVKREGFGNVSLVEPIGYIDSIVLAKNSIKIVTDSGGLQREAFFAKKQCVTVLNFAPWPETMVGNRNQLSRPIAKDIIDKLGKTMEIDDDYLPFGDGNAAEKIVSSIEQL